MASSQPSNRLADGSIVLVTQDSEQLTTVDLSGLPSPEAVRERLLSRLRIEDDDYEQCTIHKARIGQSADPTAMSSAQLWSICLESANAPAPPLFMVKSLQAFGYETSSISAAYNRAVSVSTAANKPAPNERRIQPTAAMSASGDRMTSNSANNERTSRKPPALSDQLLENFFLQPNPAREDEQHSAARSAPMHSYGSSSSARQPQQQAGPSRGRTSDGQQLPTSTSPSMPSPLLETDRRSSASSARSERERRNVPPAVPDERLRQYAYDQSRQEQYTRRTSGGRSTDLTRDDILAAHSQQYDHDPRMRPAQTRKVPPAPAPRNQHDEEGPHWSGLRLQTPTGHEPDQYHRGNSRQGVPFAPSHSVPPPSSRDRRYDTAPLQARAGPPRQQAMEHSYSQDQYRGLPPPVGPRQRNEYYPQVGMSSIDLGRRNVPGQPFIAQQSPARTKRIDLHDQLPLKPGETLQHALRESKQQQKSANALRSGSGAPYTGPPRNQYMVQPDRSTPLSSEQHPRDDLDLSFVSPRRHLVPTETSPNEARDEARERRRQDIMSHPKVLQAGRGAGSPSMAMRSSPVTTSSLSSGSSPPSQPAQYVHDLSSDTDAERPISLYSAGTRSTTSEPLTPANEHSLPSAPPTELRLPSPTAPDLWEDDFADGDTATWKPTTSDLSAEADNEGGTVRLGGRNDYKAGTARQESPAQARAEHRSPQLANSSPALSGPSRTDLSDDDDIDAEAATWGMPMIASSSLSSSATSAQPDESETGSEKRRPQLSRLQIVPSAAHAGASQLSGTHPPLSQTSDRNQGLPSGPADSVRNNTRLRALRTSSPIARRNSFARPDDWAHRPAVTQILDNIEDYFPEHDVDKPIVDSAAGAGESPRSSSSAQGELPIRSLPPGIGIRSKKSIRVVAQDRRRVLQRGRGSKPGLTAAQDVNANLLRRKSTRLWGNRVEEVTPSQMAALASSAGADSENPENFSFKWVKGDLIGKGSFGSVYLALNATTGDMLAVKQVALPKASDADDGRQASSIQALRFEIETLKDLDHPHIVQYLGFEETTDFISIFLEYVPGGSVGRCLRKHGKFEEPVIVSFTMQILEGLTYLHDRGILHRDLKADNILLDLNGTCKITDFGISKKSTSGIYDPDENTMMQGSIFWMAPEVVHSANKGYSAKCDTWSLGCVTLEMFSGRRPWDSEQAVAAMFKLGAERLAPPIPRDVKLTTMSAHFISQCFIINPDLRPTAQKLLDHRFLELPADWTFEQSSLYKSIRSRAR
ncbi:uncharacterized protein L969DRAFT_20042 [Mixia osmundae IAM 14324]|nr:uncharacterized protein L969DRAFT_20042 [Mixia osmundae IAM 14324]KEI36651.1 hypothetical protein L969DRAFT_20042 [Mixia osmundae IAM 14324]